MIEVYFENIHEQIIKTIHQTKKELKICVAWFTDWDLYQAVLEVQDKGVFVHIILANHEFNKNSKVDFKELLLRKGYVGYLGNLNGDPSEKFMHNKFCIIDNQIVITGSYNWTYKARYNDENIIIIKDEPYVIQKFNEKFESLKPELGFAVKENEVRILPIQQIIAKWEQKPVQNSDNKNTQNSSSIQNIINKF